MGNVGRDMKPTKRKLPAVVAFRPGELAPLMEHYLNLNPGITTARLIRRGLKLVLRDCAGKRYGHLLTP